MKVWGITGLIGSGKSSAIKYLQEKGIPTIDADQVARLVVDRNTEMGRQGFEKIYRAFGNAVLDNKGNLDRAALRRRIMMNPHEREILEAIMHPMIIDHIQKIMREWKDKNVPLGFIEGTRLIESGLHKYLAGIILVTTPMDLRVKRVAKRDGMDKYEVAKMLDLQDEGLMRSHSKITWNNKGTLNDLYGQIDQFVEKILKESK